MRLEEFVEELARSRHELASPPPPPAAPPADAEAEVLQADWWAVGPGGEGGATLSEATGEYVVVEHSDVVAALSQFIAAYLVSLPEARNLEPRQLQRAVAMALQVCVWGVGGWVGGAWVWVFGGGCLGCGVACVGGVGATAPACRCSLPPSLCSPRARTNTHTRAQELRKGHVRRLLDWGKHLYRLGAVGYGAFSMCTNPWVAKAVVAALWTALRMIGRFAV